MKKSLCIVLILSLFLPASLLAQGSYQQQFNRLMIKWNAYHDSKDYKQAVERAQQAFSLAQKINNSHYMAIALNREGQTLLIRPSRVKKNLKEAKEKFERSIFYLANIDDPELRIDNLDRLKLIAEKEKDFQQMVVYEKQISEINNLLATSAKNEELEENKETLENKVTKLAVQKRALTTKVQSLTEAQLESELLIALQKIEVDSLLYETARDSLLLAQKELTLVEQAAKLDLQQSQIKLQESERNLLIALMAIAGLFGFGLLLRFLDAKKHNTILATKNEIIEEEKKRSEQLLLNILPSVVAQELKTYGSAKAKKYEHATVLFSDFKNFSVIAETLTPEKLVGALDFYFKTFDDIIEKYQLEKIKTIGDAYMCVGGLPNEIKDHPELVVKAALEIQTYLSAWKIERQMNGEPFFEARMGIHTGPLVAGVVGFKKFAYDVWGDTVNVAARLESKSQTGRVNVSATTFELIKHEFDCEYRGKIAIKNKGEIEMYFVNGLAQLNGVPSASNLG